MRNTKVIKGQPSFEGLQNVIARDGPGVKEVCSSISSYIASNSLQSKVLPFGRIPPASCI